MMIEKTPKTSNQANLWRYVEKHKLPIETALRKFLPLAAPPFETEFNRAVRYALFPGGKRLRPILTLLGAEIVGGAPDAVLPAAIAVEFIHSSSLIFDDLPCMDNAAKRRGKSSVHEKYGEGLAILVALGLLNASYNLVFVNHKNFAERAIRAHAEICECVGASGMVGGQSVDLALAKGVSVKASAQNNPAIESAKNLKTSALVKLALKIGAILAGADSSRLAVLARFAALFGDAYQLGDDLLDLEDDDAIFAANKTFARNDAQTTRARLKTMIGDAKKNLLENFDASDARNNLIELTDYLAERKT